MKLKQWDEIYKRYGKFFVNPQEGMERIVGVFKEHNVKKVLDLGCGSGRHLIFLAERGFEVYGIDLAETGIKIAKDWLDEKDLHAELKIGSVYEELPYEDDFFDAVVSIRVLHHARIGDIRKAIKEIQRVLKSRGLIFITVRKRTPKKRRLKFIALDSRTYIPVEGDEKDLIHYLFNKRLLRREFRNFEIHDIWVDRENYYCLLGESKTAPK